MSYYIAAADNVPDNILICLKSLVPMEQSIPNVKLIFQHVICRTAGTAYLFFVVELNEAMTMPANECHTILYCVNISTHFCT